MFFRFFFYIFFITRLVWVCPIHAARQSRTHLFGFLSPSGNGDTAQSGTARIHQATNETSNLVEAHASVESLTGFREETADQVRSKLHVDGDTMTSVVNRKTMACGHLETPALADLRSRSLEVDAPKGRLKLSEVVGDVQQLHQDPENAGALFQVASQFNLLEMVGPSYTPEDGIDIDERDATQGPARWRQPPTGRIASQGHPHPGSSGTSPRP